MKKLKVFFILHFAGDAMISLTRLAFTTKDRDNDLHSGLNCAVASHGAWWYYACHYSNLNGRYFNEAGRNDASGISWYQWKNNFHSMKRASMKIRPNN